jgi:SAM-dependent methyltransferase
MKPSEFHSNRRWHNWILYDIGDKFLEKYSKYFNGHLVDLGCGEAPYKEYFLQFADSYTGVDWTKTQHNSKADVVSDLNVKIELDDEVADSIITLSVMEHLYEPQVFLNESYRVLKEGGTIVLQVPWQWWIHEAPHDYYRYTPYGLKYMFEKAGYKDVQIEAQTGYFTVAIVKMNYFTNRFVKGPMIIKRLIRAFMIPFWTIGQLLAPHLDKLDKRWDLETQGYFVVAKK